MNKEEIREFIKLVRENDAIASIEKWHSRDNKHPSDYNLCFFEFALHKFMDAIDVCQDEMLNYYFQNLQEVNEAVCDFLPHWSARIETTGSENLSDVMNSVFFSMHVQKICDSTDNDEIDEAGKTESVWVDLFLVDPELESVTEPTSQIAYPRLQVEEIHIQNSGGEIPAPAANDVCWSPFICDCEFFDMVNEIYLVAPNLQGSSTAPNNQGSNDDEERKAYITMGIGEICDFLSRLQFLFEQNGYKILTRAESRRRISDYRSNSSAMKGFLEALRAEDEEKTCSGFELIIEDGQLRKERAPKTESEH